MKLVDLKIIYTKLILGTVALLPLALSAQQGGVILEVDRITVDTQDHGMLNFWVKSTDNGKLKNDIATENISITEFINGRADSIVTDGVVPMEVLEESLGAFDTSTIYFLLDLSRDMTAEALRNAKQMIRQVVLERSEISGTRFYLTAYHEQAVLLREKLTADNVDRILEPLAMSEQAPDFFRFLVDDIRELKAQEGTRALFVMSSGGNVSRGAIYEKRLPYEPHELTELVKSLPSNFHLFVIDLHEDELSENFIYLNNGDTRFSKILPPDYAEVLGNSRPVRSNILIQALPGQQEFKGENRTYVIELQPEARSAQKEFRLGSINFPVNLGGETNWVNWIIWLVVGLIAVLIIYGVGSLLIPYFREREFAAKYVTPYVQEGQRTRYDIFYNEPIREGEPVVTKCRQITPFSSWKENGWQCPNYPVCLNQNCSGAGAPEATSFSSMEGVYLKLNWIWFGAMGGLIAWVIITLFRGTNFQGFSGLVGTFVDEDFLNSISLDNPELVTQTISNNLMVGVAFGAGIMLMLSWMEERRASNRYSNIKSGIRIALRTLACILLSMLVFFGGFYLQYVVGVAPYVSGLLSWLLFGLGIGLIISASSTIARMNGIIGGVIGAVIAFQVYWGLTEFLNTGFLLANLASMLLMGGIIGSILVSVVTTLEDYELEVIAPAGYQRTVPISKWLNAGESVMIGKLPGSYVYVKWDDDEVRPEHAEMFREDSSIFVRPVEEVLVNQRMISKPVALKNGDIIKLGRSSITQFRFVEK